jgi:hypothetical protein
MSLQDRATGVFIPATSIIAADGFSEAFLDPAVRRSRSP